jgi:hypothetical protein
MDLLSKRLGDIKRDLIFDNVVASSAELVRHRFDRYHTFALGSFPLIETVDFGTKPDRKVGKGFRPVRVSDRSEQLNCLPWSSPGSINRPISKRDDAPTDLKRSGDVGYARKQN